MGKSRRRRQPDSRCGAGLRCAHLRVPEPEHACREIRRFRDQDGAGPAIHIRVRRQADKTAGKSGGAKANLPIRDTPSEGPADGGSDRGGHGCKFASRVRGLSTRSSRRPSSSWASSAVRRSGYAGRRLRLAPADRQIAVLSGSGSLSMQPVQDQQTSQHNGHDLPRDKLPLVIDAMDLIVTAQERASSASPSSGSKQPTGPCTTRSGGDGAARLREDGLTATRFGRSQMRSGGKALRFVGLDQFIEGRPARKRRGQGLPARRESRARRQTLEGASIEAFDGSLPGLMERTPTIACSHQAIPGRADRRRGSRFKSVGAIRCGTYRKGPDHAGRLSDPAVSPDQAGAGPAIRPYPPQGGRPQDGGESGGRQRQMRESAGCGRRVLERGGDYTGLEGTRSNSSRALRKSRKGIVLNRVPRRRCRASDELQRAPLFLGQGACQGGIVADARLFGLRPL